MISLHSNTVHSHVWTAGFDFRRVDDYAYLNAFLGYCFFFKWASYSSWTYFFWRMKFIIRRIKTTTESEILNESKWFLVSDGTISAIFLIKWLPAIANDILNCLDKNFNSVVHSYFFFELFLSHKSICTERCMKSIFGKYL